jgi:hypothetical protein
MLNARLFALIIAIGCWASTQVAGQTAAPTANANAAGQAPAATGKAEAAAWKPSRLADGHPDLQGFWTSNTSTPLQAPTNGAGRGGRGGGPRPFPDLFGIPNGDARFAMERTSIITDPPDGRFPPMTPEAQKHFEADQEHHRLHPHDGPEDLDTIERCITWITSGPPMLPTFYNNNYQILQTKDYVMIMTEMVHDVRIIPVDGRPHGTVRQWMGDSVGHYEGNTLVVETINFNGKRGWFEKAGTEAGGERRPDKNMKVTERFTRTGPDILQYQFTVNAPDIYTKPWSGEIDMHTLKDPIIEYACKEGDQGMELILKGARADEKAAASGAQKQ